MLQGDEARHEAAYQKIFREVVARDPDTAVLAFADIMHKSVVMPAHLMHQRRGGRGAGGRLQEVPRSQGAGRLGNVPERLLQQLLLPRGAPRGLHCPGLC